MAILHNLSHHVNAFLPTGTPFKSTLSPSSSSSSLVSSSFAQNYLSLPYSHRNSRLYLDGEGMAGGTFNKHLLGDILRALQPKYLTEVQKSIQGNINGARELKLDSFITAAAAATDTNTRIMNLPPTWDELSKLLHKQQTPKERMFRTDLSNGHVHSALARFRRFPPAAVSATVDPITTPTNTKKIILYKDSASWCPYCQKVWIALEEKQIPYDIVCVDMNCYASGSKPSEFLSFQPNGNLPCAVVTSLAAANIGNNDSIEEEEEQVKEYYIIGESDAILDVLDDLAPQHIKTPRLGPDKSNSEKLAYYQYLCDDGRNSLERRLFAEWMWYLTGKRKPVEYRKRYEATLDEVEYVLTPNSTSTLAEIQDGPFFMGKNVTLVDIKFITFVERQAASLAYYKGFELRNKDRWPHLVQWLEAMEARPSYLKTKSDFYTHSKALPPQISGEFSFADGHEDMKRAIDAFSQPATTTSTTTSTNTTSKQDRAWREAGWGDTMDKSHDKKAKREAAERIIINHKNIVSFACRAAGTPGFPAAAAPLADPKAVSNVDATFPVDILLRHVVHLLLLDDNGDDTLKEMGMELSKGGKETVQVVVDCLDYLRMRVGVPRDMSYPASIALKEQLLNVATSLLDIATHGVDLDVAKG